MLRPVSVKNVDLGITYLSQVGLLWSCVSRKAVIRKLELNNIKWPDMLESHRQCDIPYKRYSSFIIYFVISQ